VPVEIFNLKKMLGLIVNFNYSQYLNIAIHLRRFFIKTDNDDVTVYNKKLGKNLKLASSFYKQHEVVRECPVVVICLKHKCFLAYQLHSL
jgi:hypothetical protein